MSETLSQLCKNLEHFQTPEWAIRAILQKEPLTLDVVDPCTGTGIMGRIADEFGYQTLYLDVHDWGHRPTRIHDWLKDDDPFVNDMVEDATVFMNPPFSRAVQFVEKAFELGARKVVCFQRFAWYESDGRRPFWEAYPPARVYICADRADCWRHDIPINSRGKRYNPETGKELAGTPTAHAWFVFERDYKGPTTLGHVRKSEVKSEKKAV